MTREHYVSVSIPETIIKEIDYIVKKKIKGYSSRAEFLKSAARDLLEKMEK